MSESWKAIDWDAPRPSPPEAIDAARRLRFHHRPDIGPACEGLLTLLRQTHINGGAMLATFDVHDDQTAAWFASRNRFDELGFFAAFLASADLRGALPSLFEGPDKHVRVPTFSEVFAGPYLIDGWLAGLLMAGGAYERFRGSPIEARTAAAAAAQEIMQGRYEDFVVYQCWDPWSPWFFDVAWDSTGLAIDLANKRVTLLAITDTD